MNTVTNVDSTLIGVRVMNKKLFAIIAAATLLTACGQSGAVIRSSDSTYDNPMVTLISEEPYGYFIAYDKDTMVMYIGKHNGEGGTALTVMVNSDGTPKLYKRQI